MAGADKAKEVRQRFGEDLRQAREQAQLSQEEVAARVGMSQGYVSLVEAGRRAVTINRMVAFADAVGLDLIIAFRPRRRQP